MASINITYVRRPCRDRQAVSFCKCVLCALCGKRLWQAVPENTNKRGELTLQGDTAVNLCARAFYLFIFFHKTIYCPHTYGVLVGVGWQGTRVYTLTHKWSASMQQNFRILPFLVDHWVSFYLYSKWFIKSSKNVCKTPLKSSFLCNTWLQLPSSVRSVLSLSILHTVPHIFSGGPSITAGPEPALFFLSALLL